MNVVLAIIAAVAALAGAGLLTLGHRYTEWIIPPAIPVYVLGTVLAGGTVGASPTKAHPFVISYKSEEERTGSLTSTRRWVLIGAIACLVLAAGLFIAAIGTG
jgi:hypothetical protein